jgi:hypothetical protein
MKKHFFLLSILAFSFLSCELDENNNQPFYFEVMPITSVEVPEQFVHGNTYEISVSYNRPSTCYQFNDFLYSISGSERSVAVVNTVYNDGCVSDPEIANASFDITILSNETYTFKFYQGEDETGVDQYLIIDIPVIEDND